MFSGTTVGLNSSQSHSAPYWYTITGLEPWTH